MKRMIVLLCAAALVAAGIFLWHGKRGTAVTGPVVAVAPGAEAIDVVVCYPPKAGLEPVEEIRRRPKPASPQDRLVQLVGELHQPPASADALPLFPPGLTPRAVFLSADGVAYLDEPVAALDRPMGARDEIVFVRSILRAIARNCPDVKAVVFLADGATRPRLCGHLPAHGRYLIPKLVPARAR
ncbi:MAG: GerMN domain-containing protein [Candidatus Coatesbacteria bacterium]